MMRNTKLRSVFSSARMNDCMASAHTPTRACSSLFKSAMSALDTKREPAAMMSAQETKSVLMTFVLSGLNMTDETDLPIGVVFKVEILNKA